MVTQEYNNDSIQVIYLTSSDTKPTSVDNGSVAIEVNTGKHYRFDAENITWHDFGYIKVII